MMKVFLFFLMFVLSVTIRAQFGTKELYGYLRYGILNGSSDARYTTVTGGASLYHPISAQLPLGSGIIVEAGLGLKVIKELYIEPYFSYSFLSRRVNSYTGMTSSISSFSFNKSSIGSNAVYFVTVSTRFTLNFSAGVGLIMPKYLRVQTNLEEERVRYSSTTGLYSGLGGSYRVGNITIGLGLRYRYEVFTIDSEYDLPMNFMFLNPKMKELNIKGVEINFTARYLF